MPIENLGVINKCISVICLKIKTYPLLISLYPKYRTNYHCSYYKGTKCNQVKINIKSYTESTNDILIIQNSYICKDIKVQTKVRDIKEKISKKNKKFLNLQKLLLVNKLREIIILYLSKIIDKGPEKRNLLVQKMERI